LLSLSRILRAEINVGGSIGYIDELMASIRAKVTAGGVKAADAIPEKYPLLRMISTAPRWILQVDLS
jgi:hypothetical protein